MLDRQQTAERLRAHALEELRTAARLEELETERDQGYANHETMLCAAQLAGNMTPGGAEYVERVHKTTRLGIRRAEHEQRARHGAAVDDVGIVAQTLREALEADLTRRVGAPDGLAGDLLASALGRVDWHELATEQLRELAAEAEQ